MRIGIDIDDTISKTSEQVDIYAKEYIERVLNREYKTSTIDSSSPLWIKDYYGWTEDEDKKFWDLYYEKAIKNVEPKDDAVDIINKLYKNNEIIIITARWEKGFGKIKRMTKKWLQKNNIHYHKLYIGHLDKRGIVQKNNIDLFIDDSIKNCYDIQKLGIKTFIMTSKQNENFDTKEIIRVNNWKDIYIKI